MFWYNQSRTLGDRVISSYSRVHLQKKTNYRQPQETKGSDYGISWSDPHICDNIAKKYEFWHFGNWCYAFGILNRLESGYRRLTQGWLFTFLHGELRFSSYRRVGDELSRSKLKRLMRKRVPAIVHNEEV